MSYRLHYAPDNASLIIRLALEELRLAYQTVLVDRRANAQRSAGYLALNPNGLIPVLETPDGVLFETGAILLWLADTHNALAPSVDAPERGDFLKWLFTVSNTVHAEMRLLFYPEKYVGADPSAVAALRRKVGQNLAHHLSKLDDLARSPAPFFGSSHITVLDLYVMCLLRWCRLYPDGQSQWFDLDAYPALRTMAQRVEQRPSVLAAQSGEGLGPTPFSAPRHATPPEGSAT